MIENLYVSGMEEEFIAMQVDVDVPTVIAVLRELESYQRLEAGKA
jgi:hypothetical protein